MNTLNSLLSTTTSRYTSLRRQLLSSSSEDDSQVDDPDSSHVSKVLRAYYTEKGRPFPPWLPPDPKDRDKQQQAQRPSLSSSGSLRGVGGRNSSGPATGAGSRGTGGGLSDLWADNPAPAQPPQESGSLRRSLAGARLGARTRTQNSEESLGPRPLPSQRAGSYQVAMVQQSARMGRTTSPVPPGSAGGGGSVQERLKARLGGRGTPPIVGRERSEGDGGSYMDGGSSQYGGTGAGYGGNPYEGTGGHGHDGGGRRAPPRQGGVGFSNEGRQGY